MTSLRQKLINYIRLQRQVHFRDIEKYAEENKYKAYTAVRRLQEVRDPKDLKHYDPDIHIIDENGKIDGDGTIKWYIYRPPYASNYAPQQEKPAEPYVWTPKPKPHPITQSDACCPIFQASQGRMHAGTCETQKQIHF